MNLRERIEEALARTLEGEFALPVILISPDGETQDKLADETPLRGQIIYGLARLNPETGEDVVVDNEVVVLRRSSLTRIPKAGENWIVKIPETPSTTAAMVHRSLSATRPPEGGRSIGFIRLYLQEVEEQET